MVRQAAFVRDVKDALSNLYDPIHLQTHPLVQVLAVPRRVGETTGETLRALLWQTIESLRPGPTVPARRPEWLSYRILWLYYVQAMPLPDVCQELGLSQRSFYRRHREALEAVASILWEQHRATDEDEGPTQPEGAPEEAVRLARQARRQPMPLRLVLQRAIETVQPLAEKEQVTLCLAVPETLPIAYGDPAMFHQIVLNVLTVGIRLARGDTISLRVEVAADHTRWSLAGLRDDGAEAVADELAISRALLAVYGGELRLDLGRADLGRADAGRADAGRAATGSSTARLWFTIPSAQPPTVLIIDDDASTIALYSRYLQEDGYVIQTARRAAEVKALIHDAPPDLVLLDVLMPEEDGWRLLQRLRTWPQTAAIPVIICSVLSQPGLALALGATAVLQKPIAAADLLTTVREALAQ